MKIALVHDYLVQYGGAERVLECFAEIFPEAYIHTIVYDKEAMHGVFKGKKIRVSSLQKYKLIRKKHRFFPFLMMNAVEEFDFSAYDVVLSDSSSFAKSIITGPKTLHISYVHTPMRYAWDDCQKYTDDFGFPGFIKFLVPYAMNYIRVWDKTSAERVDRYITNSNFVAKRIGKYYRKKAEVIHPPVAINSFYVSERQQDYFLMVGRLLAYKRHDIAIQAFKASGLPLKIIGRGPEMERLKKMSGPNIEFLGRVAEKDLPKYYAECRAFVFPQEEDFGIVAIEAMASGRPVIAYRGGDIPEHIQEGKNGIFFEKQTAEDILGAVEKFQKMSFDASFIRQQTLKFDREIFKEKIKVYVEKALTEHKQKMGEMFGY